jgi:hypothetical protein
MDIFNLARSAGFPEVRLYGSNQKIGEGEQAWMDAVATLMPGHLGEAIPALRDAATRKRNAEAAEARSEQERAARRAPLPPDHPDADHEDVEIAQLRADARAAVEAAAQPMTRGDANALLGALERIAARLEARR